MYTLVISSLQSAGDHYLCIYDAPRFFLDSFCCFISSNGIELSSVAGIRVDAKTYIELVLEAAVEIIRMKEVCSRFGSALHGVESLEITIYVDSSIVCKMFKARVEQGPSMSWTKPKAGEERPLLQFKSALDILKSCLSYEGLLDATQVKSVAPPMSKPTLFFTKLDDSNAASFCKDAVEAIAENILVNCAGDSPFYEVNMKDCLTFLESKADCKDRASGIGLCLLIHASKAVKKGRKNIFIQLVEHLAASKLKIVPSPSSFREAFEMLHKQPLKTVLLGKTGLPVSALDEIENIFVEFPSKVRGWCGPSMAIINISALQDSMHLDEPIPMAALLGHENMHALVRKSQGDDLNFSSPTKPDIVMGREYPHRESGLFFELTAFGQKFEFPKLSHEALVHLLIEEISAGLNAGNLPALSPIQVAKFQPLVDDWSEEFGFDCPRAGIKEF